MPPRVYATPEQLTAWTGQPPPPDADRLLMRASEDVDDALAAALYDVDRTTGMPTDPNVIQALTDATCAQVEHWQATGSDGTGADAMWDNVSIGGVSLSGRRHASAGPEVALAPRAYRALKRAGLLPGVIV